DQIDRLWPGLDQTRRRHEALRRVFGAMVEDALACSGKRLAEAAPGSLAAVQALPGPVVAFSDRTATAIAEIKSFLFVRMYRHHRVKRMRVKAVRVVRELFAIFMAD